MSTETPPKERSVPKPVFTDAEAGSQEFPSSDQPLVQLLHAGQAPRDGLRGRHRRRPARSRAPPHPGLDLRLRRRHQRLPEGVDEAQVLQLAPVPRPQRGVGADDLPQQRERRPPGPAEHRQRQGGATRSRSGTAPWVDIVAKHVGAWAHAEHGLGMHVYMPANRDAPTNMINNALSVGAVHKLRFAQDVILYNLELDDEIEGFDGQAHMATWSEDPVWQEDARERRAADRHARLGRGVLRHRGRVRAARRRAVPQRLRDADRRAAGRLRDADAVRLRPSPTPRASSAARGGCSRCSPRTRRAAPRTSRRCRTGSTKWTPISIEAARTLQPIWSQPAEKAMRFEESMERSSQRFERLLSDIGLETPKEA